MSMAASLQFDLGYIQATIEELGAYLLSDELFWSLSGHTSPEGTAYPKLTLGGVLLALARSRARADSPQITSTVDRLDNRLGAVQSRWRVAWEKKANWEFRSRLGQWGNYLDEVQRHPQEHAAYYAYEVRLRVFLALLILRTEQIAESEADLLAKLDQKLRAQFVPGAFLWEHDLRAGFPEDSFWFLWGKLAV